MFTDSVDQASVDDAGFTLTTRTGAGHTRRRTRAQEFSRSWGSGFSCQGTCGGALTSDRHECTRGRRIGPIRGVASSRYGEPRRATGTAAARVAFEQLAARIEHMAHPSRLRARIRAQLHPPGPPGAGARGRPRVGSPELTRGGCHASESQHTALRDAGHRDPDPPGGPWGM